jgi:hypothetical protein
MPKNETQTLVRTWTFASHIDPETLTLGQASLCRGFGKSSAKVVQDKEFCTNII